MGKKPEDLTPAEIRQMDEDLRYQYHSIYFERTVNGSLIGRDTWVDWRLIPSSRPVVAEAKPVEKYVDVIGKQGQLDLSEWPAGLQYQDRTGSWEFLVTNNRVADWPSAAKALPMYYIDQVGDIRTYSHESQTATSVSYLPDWEDLRTEISNFLNGSIVKVVLMDDPGYYFTGRCRLESWNPEANFSKVHISYHLSPYKTRAGDPSEVLL